MDNAKNKSILFTGGTSAGKCQNCVFFRPDKDNQNKGKCDGVFEVKAEDGCVIDMFSPREKK